MIEYVPRSGPPEAMHCPALVCDTCRKQIVGKGNVVWVVKVVRSDSESRQQSPLFAAHKGRCDRALDLWLEKQYDIGNGWIHMWEEAGTFLKQLAYNLEHAFADDKQGEYHPHITKQPKNDPHDALPDFD